MLYNILKNEAVSESEVTVKNNVILSEAKNLVCICLCFRDPSLRSG